jgi:hypothetical protein
VDAQDYIYVADSSDGRIVRVNDMSGTGWTTHGRQGSGLQPGQFDLLTGIALASDDRIFVTDVFENVVISVNDMTGAGYAYFGYVGNDSLFKQASGIFVDGTGPVYVASQNNNRIARFQDIQGTGFTTLGRVGAGVGEFDQPIDVVVARISN